MNGQGACSLLLQLRPHRDDGVRARRRGAADATADVKRVAGDGPEIDYEGCAFQTRPGGADRHSLNMARLQVHKRTVPLAGAGFQGGIQTLALFYSRSNLANVLPPAVNVSISNMFGPKFTLYANGAELLHSYPVSIVTHGIGLNITLQSYRDHLDFGFIAGANILPNVQSLADSLPDELTKLEAADDLAS